jgi:hypothetical protein
VERLTTQKEKKIITPLTKNKKNKIKALQLPREHRKATAQLLVFRCDQKISFHFGPKKKSQLMIIINSFFSI